MGLRTTGKTERNMFFIPHAPFKKIFIQISDVRGWVARRKHFLRRLLSLFADEKCLIRHTKRQIDLWTRTAVTHSLTYTHTQHSAITRGNSRYFVIFNRFIQINGFVGDLNERCSTRKAIKIEINYRDPCGNIFVCFVSLTWGLKPDPRSV